MHTKLTYHLRVMANMKTFSDIQRKRYYHFQYLTEKNGIMKNSLSAREGNLQEKTRHKKQTDTESGQTRDSDTALHTTSAS